MNDEEIELPQPELTMEQKALQLAAQRAYVALMEDMSEDLSGKQVRRAVEVVLAHAVVPIKAASAYDIGELIHPLIKAIAADGHHDAAAALGKIAITLSESAADALAATQ